MKIRPAQSGDLADSMSKIVEISSKEELLEYLKKHYDFWNPTDTNVTIEFYCKDSRIGWDTYIICVAGKAALFSDGKF